MTLDSKQTTASEELQYASGGLKRETDWRGAFVMGLAGTILVTGIGPVMVTALGAASTPINIFITFTAWLNILFIAELAAMMPERTGGSPSYAYPAYSARWPRMAKHINGFTAWAYWLGWFPVAPLNMILASFYLADRFGINTTAGFTPVHTFIAWSTVIISMIGILLFFIPAYRGIRFGTGFATVLAVLSMIPLTFIAVAWMFNPSVVNLGELTGFRHVDGSSFFSPIGGFNWLQVYIAYGFLLSWNVVGIESAACYIGECANPDRDAKIALNLEGAYATFIFTLIPIAFIVVLGAKALSDPTSGRPENDVRYLRRQSLPRRRRPAHELGHRLHADHSALPFGPQRHHGLRSLAISDGARWRIPALVHQDQSLWRAGQRHVLQRRLLHDRSVGRWRGGNLQLLQCRLCGLLPPGPDRLLPAAP